MSVLHYAAWGVFAEPPDIDVANAVNNEITYLTRNTQKFWIIGRVPPNGIVTVYEYDRQRHPAAPIHTV